MSTSKRLHPFVKLEPNELASIISPVVQAAPEDLEIAELPGDINSSYRVRHENADLLVHLIVGDLNAYLKEFNILARYRDRLPLHKAVSFQLSSPESRGYPVAIHEWIEGITLEECLSTYPEHTANVAQSVGKTLAQFAELRYNSSGFLSSQLELSQPLNMNRDGYLDYMSGLLTHSLAGQRLDKLCDSVWQYISFHAKWMDTIPTQSNLVHGNLQRKNVIVRPSSLGASVVGLLDWELALSWTSLFDMSQLLDGSFSNHQEFEYEMTQAFQGSGGYMPQGWRLINNLLRLLSSCDRLARPTCPASVQQTDIASIATVVRE